MSKSKWATLLEFIGFMTVLYWTGSALIWVLKACWFYATKGAQP